LNKSIQNLLKRPSPVHALLRRRAASLYWQCQPHLLPSDHILDIGCGPGFFSDLLRQNHPSVNSLDILDQSYFPHIRPVIYDGLCMPFADHSFHWATIIAVLHHCFNPVQVITEAARVAQKLIIIEDVLKTNWHRYPTGFLDNLYNLDFFDNPHNNKTEPQWRALFTRLSLRVTAVKRQWNFGPIWQRRSVGPIWQHIYILEKSI
jgi:ubiquinone/menaquinone biosynthesis C-methylase UbiE